MDDALKEKLTELYDFHCMMLVERGTVDPMYFLIKEKMFTPLLIPEGDEMCFNSYTVESLKIASEFNVDAMVLITEQDAVIGKAGSPDIKALIDGKMRPSDHPSKQLFLVLTYIHANGEKAALYGKIEMDPTGTKFIRHQEWSTKSLYNKVPWK